MKTCMWLFIATFGNSPKLESPLDCKDIKPVNPKGNQSWIFTRRTDAEAEAPILCPPDAKSWLIGKDPDAEKDWGQEEKGMTEDEMAGCHHWLSGHEFEQTPGDGEGQGSLVCCNPGMSNSWTWLSDWATTTNPFKFQNTDSNSLCQNGHHLFQTSWDLNLWFSE